MRLGVLKRSVRRRGENQFTLFRGFAAGMTAGAAAVAGETILVVDDEEDIREAMRRILARGGYTVVVAAGPADALSVTRDYEGSIDLLLTDVLMPQMSGHELATLAGGERAELKVLYVSGYSKAVAVMEGVVSEDEVLLEKPFTRDTLLGAVRRVLGPPR